MAIFPRNVAAVQLEPSAGSSSLEQLMKVHGLLRPDGAINVNVDARKQVVQVLANLGEDELRALVAGGAMKENETPFRDAKASNP